MRTFIITIFAASVTCLSKIIFLRARLNSHARLHQAFHSRFHRLFTIPSYPKLLPIIQSFSIAHLFILAQIFCPNPRRPFYLWSSALLVPNIFIFHHHQAQSFSLHQDTFSCALRLKTKTLLIYVFSILCVRFQPSYVNFTYNKTLLQLLTQVANQVYNDNGSYFFRLRIPCWFSESQKTFKHIWCLFDFLSSLQLKKIF